MSVCSSEQETPKYPLVLCCPHTGGHRDSLQGQCFCHQLCHQLPQPLPSQAPLAAVCPAPGHSSGEAAGTASPLHGTDATLARGCPAVTPPCQDGFLSCFGSSQSGGAGVFINRDVCLHHSGPSSEQGEAPQSRPCPGWRKHLLSTSRWLLSHPRSRQIPEGFPDK